MNKINEWKKSYIQLRFPIHKGEQKENEANYLLDANKPKFLYKYRSLNLNAIKNLEDGTVWAAHPKTLNDPYECRFKLCIDEMRDLFMKGVPGLPRPTVPPPDDLLYNFVDGIIDQFQKIGICAFSENLLSSPMWAYYAEDGKGFCIEYDTKDFNDDFYSYFYPVLYEDDPVDFTNFLTLFISEKNAQTPEDKVTYLSSFIRCGYLAKSQEWQHELEWRLVWPDIGDKKGVPFKCPKPTAVYLGTYFEKNDNFCCKKNLIDLCNSQGIPIKQMGMVRNSFDLCYKPY